MGGKPSIPKKSGWVNLETLKEVGGWERVVNPETLKGEGGPSIPEMSGWVGNPETLKGVGGWEP